MSTSNQNLNVCGQSKFINILKSMSYRSDKDIPLSPFRVYIPLYSCKFFSQNFFDGLLWALKIKCLRFVLIFYQMFLLEIFFLSMFCL